MHHIKQLAKHNWLIHHTLKECESKHMSETRTLARLVEVLAKENHQLRIALTEQAGVCDSDDDPYLSQVANLAYAEAG